VRVFTLGAAASGGMRQVISWLQAERGAVDPAEADIIEAHGWRAGWRGRALARRLGLPLVVVVHAYPPAPAPGRWLWWGLEHGLRPAPSAYVAVSRPLARWVGARVGGPVAVVPLVPPRPAPLPRGRARAALGLPAGERLVGTIGRLVPDKGCDLLLEAWARLPDPVRRGWRLVVVGDGPQRVRLQRLARRLGVAGTVIWPGAVDGAGRLVQAFDVYVQASRREGLGLAALEAAAAGVPAVLTLGGGLAEIAPLAPAAVPEASPAALAAGLLRLITMDDAARRRAGQDFRRRAEARFPPGAGLAALTDWYARLAVPGGPGPQGGRPGRVRRR